MLSEKDDTYDLRLYKLQADVSIQKDIGGEVQETQTEIRGIDGVTTVRTVGNTTSIGTAFVATYEIKFELIGSVGRVKYRDRILIPGMMKVKGLKILRLSPMHRTNARGTIRTVRETLKEYGGGVSNMGGMAGNLGSLRSHTGTIMRTPTPSIQNIIDDWVEGGVRMYDAPAQNNLMRYHVMMSVEEILDSGLLSRTFRAPKDAYDGMYHNFIANGPQSPVYIAVGQNGRAKITGGEDIVWFAKEAGLQEVPCFFSYQRQA